MIDTKDFFGGKKFPNFTFYSLTISYITNGWEGYAVNEWWMHGWRETLQAMYRDYIQIQ